MANLEKLAHNVAIMVATKLLANFSDKVLYMFYVSSAGVCARVHVFGGGLQLVWRAWGLVWTLPLDGAFVYFTMKSIILRANKCVIDNSQQTKV